MGITDELSNQFDIVTFRVYKKHVFSRHEAFGFIEVVLETRYNSPIIYKDYWLSCTS